MHLYVMKRYRTTGIERLKTNVPKASSSMWGVVRCMGGWSMVLLAVTQKRMKTPALIRWNCGMDVKPYFRERLWWNVVVATIMRCSVTKVTTEITGLNTESIANYTQENKKGR